jgi:hypothetical protein
MNLSPKLKWILTAAFIAAATLAWIILQPNHDPQRLPDGSVLVLDDLQFGTNIHFERTQALSLTGLFSRILPADAIHWVNDKFWAEWGGTRYESVKDPFLVVQFRLRLANETTNFLASAEPDTVRWNIAGDNGVQYVGRFDGFKGHDGEFTYAFLSAFPRSSKHLQIKLEKLSSDNRTWEKVAEFTTPNPGSATKQDWQPSTTPITLTRGKMEFTLERVTTERAIARRELSLAEGGHDTVSHPIQWCAAHQLECIRHLGRGRNGEHRPARESGSDLRMENQGRFLCAHEFPGHISAHTALSGSTSPTDFDQSCRYQLNDQDKLGFPWRY